MTFIDSCAERSVSSLWETVISVLGTSGFTNVEINFVKTLHFVGVEKGICILETQNKFTRDWAEKHFSKRILKILVSIDSTIENLSLKIAQNERRFLEVPSIALSPVQIKRKEHLVQKKQYEVLGYVENTFQNFVEGLCNREALSMCKKVAEEPCRSDALLLYIYGKSGLGKTHLLQAIAYAIKESKRNVSVKYTSGIRFLEDFLKCFEGNAKNKEAAENDFRETYEQVDLLLLDDVQFLAKRSGVQLALLNVIERRRLHGRQTVFSSDRLPTEMDQRYFKAKFLNRLEECIALKLEMPDSKTRLGVVERATLEFPFLEKERHEICRWIATPAVDNFRTLIGKIKRLQAEYELQRKTLTLNSVRLFLLPGQSGRTLEAITAATAAAYGVECESLLSPSRIEKISFVRKIAMFICREDTGESLQTIGEFFGRNYSTVIASCNSVMTMLENNEDLAFRIQEIRYSFGK